MSLKVDKNNQKKKHQWYFLLFMENEELFARFAISRKWRWESHECTLLTPLTKENMAQVLTCRLSY